MEYFNANALERGDNRRIFMVTERLIRGFPKETTVAKEASMREDDQLDRFVQSILKRRWTGQMQTKMNRSNCRFGDTARQILEMSCRGIIVRLLKIGDLQWICGMAAGETSPYF
jgi:hypothetical protein